MENRDHRGAKLAKKRWQPRKWDPIYDQMVALSCTGMSNKGIGEKFGYTAQQVSNILTSDNGKLIKSLVSKHIQEELMKDASTRLAQTEKRAHEIIHAVLNNNDLLVSNPIAMYDRAIKFLEGRGQLEDPTKKREVTERTMLIDSGLASKLIEGIAKANQAVHIHGGVEVRSLPNGSNTAGNADRKAS